MAGAPGNVPVSAPVPDAERWNAMRMLSGDQVAELPPVVRNCTLLPSALIKNRSTRLGGLPGGLFRALSKTILFGYPLPFWLFFTLVLSQHACQR